MLARNPYRCLQCGEPMSSPRFAFHAGRPENGPAYWSDQGVLCSPRCAHDHAARNRRDGVPMLHPAANPLNPSEPARG